MIHTPRLQLPYETHDDDICALLRSGMNVITTAGDHYPAAHGAARLAMFDEAARAGGATLYGTGMNPGYLVERLVLGLTGICTDVQRIEVVELLDASTMLDPDFVFTVMGMGSDPASLDLQAGPLATLYGKLYGEAITFLADRMHVTLEEIQPDHRVVAAERDLQIGACHIFAGTVAATEWRWHAISRGYRFFTLSVIWTMDMQLADYRGRNHWTVEIKGRPDLQLSLDMSHPAGTGLRTKAGQYVTAGAVINAIGDVVAAPPGVFTPPVFAPFVRPAPAWAWLAWARLAWARLARARLARARLARSPDGLGRRLPGRGRLAARLAYDARSMQPPLPTGPAPATGDAGTLATVAGSQRL